VLLLYETGSHNHRLVRLPHTDTKGLAKVPLVRGADAASATNGVLVAIGDRARHGFRVQGYAGPRHSRLIQSALARTQLDVAVACEGHDEMLAKCRMQSSPR
jgi:hypothetical protein